MYCACVVECNTSRSAPYPRDYTCTSHKAVHSTVQATAPAGKMHFLFNILSLLLYIASKFVSTGVSEKVFDYAFT